MPTPASLVTTSSASQATGSAGPVTFEGRYWIDTHAHPYMGPGQPGTCYSATCLDGVITVLDRWHVARSFMMPTPHADRLEDEDDLEAAAEGRSSRFAFLAGGHSLNPMIQEAKSAGTVSDALRGEFVERAEAIAASGAVGYGETTALHFSFNSNHPYVEVAPDHELFLLLADKSAEHGRPIDLHIEVVVQDKSTPPRLRMQSSQNPQSLKANLAAFERLLDHNPEAKIVWAHIGWDNSGDMTAELVGRLMQDHPNLYLQLRVGLQQPVFTAHTLLDSNQQLRPEWKTVVEGSPDRIVMGSDLLYGMSSSQVETQMQLMDNLLKALPESVAAKIGHENARQIYGLE